MDVTHHGSCFRTSYPSGPLPRRGDEVSAAASAIPRTLPNDQVLVVRSEDMRREREPILSQIFEFFGIDPGRRAPVFDEEFLTMTGRRMPRRLFHSTWYSPIPSPGCSVPPRSLQGCGPRDNLKCGGHRIGRHVDTPSGVVWRGLLRDDVKQLYDFLDEGFDGWGSLDVSLMSRASLPCAG